VRKEEKDGEAGDEDENQTRRTSEASKGHLVDESQVDNDDDYESNDDLS